MHASTIVVICTFCYHCAGTTDYVAPHSPFREFGQDLRRQCMEVFITDDTEAETTESFTLRLVQPSEAIVHISPQELTVLILDDDCELFQKSVVLHSILLSMHVYSCHHI